MAVWDAFLTERDKEHLIASERGERPFKAFGQRPALLIIDDYYGVNLVKGRDSGVDDDGHGTHVSGIIAGHGDNATGVSGLCWTGSIVPVKFMDSQGIAAIARAQKCLAPEGGTVVIRAPREQARKVFEITGLSELIRVED